MHTARATGPALSRLGFAALSLNGVIGAGIFALPAVAAAAAGPLSPWLFVLCAIAIMTLVFSFARAASFFCNTGGPITYVGHAFGPFAGFQVGWLYTLARVAGFAANTNLLLTYVAWFWPDLAAGTLHHLGVTLVTGLFVYANVTGLRRGMGAIYALTVLKLIPLLTVVLLGVGQVRPEALFGRGLPGTNGLSETILVLLYAFVGFESAVIPAGEARDPRRDIPRALIWSVVAVTVLYVLIQTVAVAAVPGVGASDRPLVDVASTLFGRFGPSMTAVGAGMMAAGAAFSIAGNNTSMLFSAPRMVSAMAQQNLLPAWLGRTHPRFGTPANAVLLLGALALGLGLSGSFLWLAAMSTVVRLLVYASVILSLPRLHTALPIGEQPMRLPGGYAIPAAGLLLCAWLVTFASARSWATAGVFAAVGAGLFWISFPRTASQRPMPAVPGTSTSP